MCVITAIFFYFLFLSCIKDGVATRTDHSLADCYTIVLKTYVVIENKIQGFFKPLENFRDMPEEAYLISFFKHKM